MGGTVIIHPARTAASSRGAGASLVFVLLCLHRSLLGDHAGGEVAPQRHDQLVRQRDDRDAPGPAAGVGGAGAEPLAELAARLMAQPQPGEFDRLEAGAWIACFADALLAIDAAAAPRA